MVRKRPGIKPGATCNVPKGNGHGKKGGAKRTAPKGNRQGEKGALRPAPDAPVSPGGVKRVRRSGRHKPGSRKNRQSERVDQNLLKALGVLMLFLECLTSDWWLVEHPTYLGSLQEKQCSTPQAELHLTKLQLAAKSAESAEMAVKLAAAENKCNELQAVVDKQGDAAVTNKELQTVISKLQADVEHEKGLRINAEGEAELWHMKAWIAGGTTRRPRIPL